MISEPLGGAHRDPAAMTETLRQAIAEQLEELCALPVDRLLEERLQKYLRIGVFAETA